MGTHTSQHKMKLILVALVIASVLVTADELKDLSSADTPAPAVETKVEKAGGAQLGESEGFGGALMTSGSFTLMAAGGAFEEEEGELGEGEGFGGALMTSGSFTMMATTAGFEE